MTDRDALVPDPLVSDRQYCRFYHLDVSALDDEELADELHFLRPLLWGLDSQHWLRERVQMIENELLRRSDTRHEFRQLKPKPAKGVVL